MAENVSLNTSADQPVSPAALGIALESADPPLSQPQTCSSKNCVNKIQNKEKIVEDKKSNRKKKQHKKRKGSSDSDSDDSDESDSSSESDSDRSQADSSDSDSSSSDKDGKRDKKGRTKSNKSSRKAEDSKTKRRLGKTRNRKSRQIQYEESDDSDSSDDGSVESSTSSGIADLRKELESKGLLSTSRRRGRLLRDILRRASRKVTDDDTKSTRSRKSERSSKNRKSKSDKKDKKAAEKDVSKFKYKRLDEIWDEDLYDYRLKETSDKKKSDEWEKYIFTVRRKFDTDNHYQSTMVDIKSLLLRDCLKVVMEGVQGVSLVERTPRLSPDMLFLYLEDFREYLLVLSDAKKKGTDKTVKKALRTKIKHLEVLIGYLDKDYDEMKKTLYPMLDRGIITFELLWALYKPNTLAYQATYSDENQPRAFRIDYACKERHYIKGLYYNIEGKYLDYDGENFGWAFIDAEVNQFQGARKITSLPCYPLIYHQNQEAIKVKLIDRGKRFLTLAGMNYKLCKGICFVKKENQVLKANINGRVMIDPKTFRRINPNYSLPDVEPRDLEDENDECRCEKPDQPRKPKQSPDKLFMIDSKGQEKEDRNVLREVEIIEMSSTDPRAPDSLTDSVKRAEAAKVTFNEEELLVASPVLTGFCFSEKLWVEITVSTVTDMQWNEGAFDSLVIPDKHKSIVRALVTAHGQYSSKSIDDIVSGKGKGLVAVLHGKPGLGKTLTCEAVADLLKRPLYSVSAGDLGTGASNLEFQLQGILDVAHTWGAVLLLDEADVFLEERSSHDVHRNALVSIFLRLLEYFSGILFLTTNRVETFDEAFVSRIHLSLRYGELTTQARKSIWKTFIAKVAESGARTESDVDAADVSSSIGTPTPDTTASTPNSGVATPTSSAPVNLESSTSIASGDSDITVTAAPQEAVSVASNDTTKASSNRAVEKFTEANYSELARVELNGRQIKNLVKTAQALALYENVPMGMMHLRRCIEVGRSFEMDLKGGRGWEEAMRSYT